MAPSFGSVGIWRSGRYAMTAMAVAPEKRDGWPGDSRCVVLDIQPTFPSLVSEGQDICVGMMIWALTSDSAWVWDED